MRRTTPGDKNLFFNVRRERLQNPLHRGNFIPKSYRETGLFNVESGVQPYPETPAGMDKNTFFRIAGHKQPTLRKRVFKDLEPMSRVIGSLDLTKSERQATAVVAGIQSIRKLLDGFLSGAKIGADGLPVLDPVTGAPVVEVKSLQEILQVSHSLLFALLRQNNVVPSAGLTVIVNSMTSGNVQTLMAKMEDTMAAQPGASAAERSALLEGAVLEERLKDIADVDEKTEESIVEVVSEQKVPSTWEDSDPTVFARSVFGPRDWSKKDAATGEPANKIALNALVAARMANLDRPLLSVNGASLRLRSMGLQFSKGHWLDLDTLKFSRREPDAFDERRADSD